ncbi:MAG: phosphoglucomutase/phosphomannomutase PgmG [Geminicoccaceae bacterium]
MTAPYTFHSTILREYDVRGIVGETLHTSDARALGQAFGTIVKNKGGSKVAVGYDGRLSSPDMEAAVVEGLVAAGMAVARIGCGPTPMLYFAVHHLNADGGIQITGSHNPPSHNGFKMMIGTKPFFGAQIQELGKIAADGAFAEGQGRAADAPVFDDYIARLARDYHGERAITAVWDAGNGAPGPAMKALTEKLPGTHHLLFEDIDGTFPNHHPDPTVPENLEALIAKVAETGAEVGIGFDGDGDRIGLVDGQGRILYGDQMLQILASDVLERHPGATIVADVKASQALFEKIAELGGEPLMWKTGHSLIKNVMAERQSPLAGEMSGHIFYKDGFYGHDDALYVAVRLLDILGRSDKTLAQWRDDMAEMINTPELRFECPDERKFTIIQAIKDDLADQGAEVNDIDGVRVNTEDGWWLVRASNTQAVLVARAEAKTADGLERLKEQIRAALRKQGVEPPAF